MPDHPPTVSLPLTLLHGWGMNAAVWDDWTRDGALDAEVRAIELPGHGERPFPPDCRDLADWATDCLDQAPERSIWVGWSLGGLIALAAALQAPKRVAGLLLVTATPRFVRAVDWTPAMPPETLDQFHAGLLADPAETLGRFLALQVRGSETARETLRGLRRGIASRPAPDPAALSIGLDLLREDDLRGRLPDIHCPALWLFGTHDTLVPAAAAERIGCLMPGARTRIIQGAAHAPQLSHPREVRAAIDELRTMIVDADAGDTTTPTPNVAWCSPLTRVSRARPDQDRGQTDA